MLWRVRFRGQRLLTVEHVRFTQKDGKMGTAAGSVIGALLVIWNALPIFGVHVNPVPDSVNGAAVALIGFLVGMFTKPPAPKDPAKTAAALAEAQVNHEKALAEYEKRTGVTK